jgi:hypothetical protein
MAIDIETRKRTEQKDKEKKTTPPLLEKGW